MDGLNDINAQLQALQSKIVQYFSSLGQLSKIGWIFVGLGIFLMFVSLFL